MAGFKLDNSGDIGVDNNGNMLLLNTYQELVQQRLQIKLRTFKGEWFLDTFFGIPYRDTGDGKSIIGKGFTKRDTDAVYIAAINEDVDVEGIQYFSSVYNPLQRAYDLVFEVRTKDEVLSSKLSAVQPWDEETYTYSNNLITSSCTP